MKSKILDLSHYPKWLRSYCNLGSYINDLSIGIDFSIWVTLQNDLFEDLYYHNFE